uniref:hypothetical protein n=1 Tax=Nitrososphaera sp. TaxID=1971748 RepID=UPI00307D1D93
MLDRMACLMAGIVMVVALAALGAPVAVKAAELFAVLLPKEDRAVVELMQSSILIKVKADPGSSITQRIEEAISQEGGEITRSFIDFAGNGGGPDDSSKVAETIVQSLNDKLAKAGSGARVESATFSFAERVWKKDADASSLVIGVKLQVTNMTITNVASAAKEGDSSAFLVNVGWKNLLDIDKPIIASVATISNSEVLVETDINSAGGIIRTLDPALEKMIDSDPEIRNALSSPILTFDAVDVVPISEWRFLYDESVCTAPFASVPDPLVSMIKCRVPELMSMFVARISVH